MAEAVQPDSVPEREPQRSSSVRRWAVFTASDGSPGYSEEQGLDESDDDFFIRIKQEDENGGGFVHCDGIYVAIKDNSMYSRLLHEKGVPLENLKTLDNGEKMKTLAHLAIETEYGDSWEKHRHTNLVDERGRWHSGGSQAAHEVCPWPNIDHVIDVIIDEIAPRIVGQIVNKAESK